MIWVDDVQWCDSASIRYLAYLVKRIEGLPVLLVLALRTGEQHPDDALLAEIALDTSVTVLRPAPLSHEAAGALVRDRLGDGADSFVDACHRMTSGNPLLLRQLLRALEDERIPPDVSHVDTVRAVGSRAVSALVTLRLRRMSATATATARAVAVLGDAAGLPTIAALAQQPEDHVATALDTLSRSEILTDGHRPTFVHPLIGDAVYEDLPSAERALHHERAARILTHQGAAAEQVAAHLLRAPRRGSAATVDLLRTAARTARSRGASDSAVVLLRRALEEPVDARREDRTAPRAGHRRDPGRRPGGRRAPLRGVLDARRRRGARPARDGHRPHPRLRLASWRGHRLRTAGRGRGRPGSTTNGRAWWPCSASPGSCTGYRWSSTGQTRSRRCPVTATVRGCWRPPCRTSCCATATERDRAVALARFALEGDRLLAVDNGLLWIVAANVLLLADEDLGDFWERAMARAHAGGELFAALSVNLWRGFTQWRHGQLDDALQSLADATEQQRMWGVSAVTSTYAAAFTLGVLLDQGDLEAASASLVSARELPWIGEGGRLLREAAARFLVEEGRPAEALDVLAAPVDYPEVRNPAWAPWRGLEAQALAALGQADRALALVDEEVALLRDWGAASALGRSLRLRGELRGVDGTADLREAVDVLSGTPVVVEAARAQVSLARSPGIDDLEAVALLESALGTARESGARAVVRDAVADAHETRAGTRGGRRERHAPDRAAAARERARRSRARRQRGRPTTVPHTGDGALRPRVDPGARTVTAGPQRRAAQTCGLSPRWFKSSSSRCCHAQTPRS